MVNIGFACLLHQKCMLIARFVDFTFIKLLVFGENVSQIFALTKASCFQDTEKGRGERY